MTHNPLMSREPVHIPPRPKLSDMAMLRIWLREGGVCWWCGQDVAQRGPEVRYDHKLPRELTGRDDEALIFPIHRDPCDREKYSREDRPAIDKAHRQAKLAAPRVPSRRPIRSRSTWPKGRKLQSRGFR